MLCDLSLLTMLAKNINVTHIKQWSSPNRKGTSQTDIVVYLVILRGEFTLNCFHECDYKCCVDFRWLLLRKNNQDAIPSFFIPHTATMKKIVLPELVIEELPHPTYKNWNFQTITCYMLCETNCMADLVTTRHWTRLENFFVPQPVNFYHKANPELPERWETVKQNSGY